jgi:exonuclease III
MHGHTHVEYNDISLAANLFRAIEYSSVCISITPLFSSSSLLLDVVTLQSLQFLLALCRDVHPNPGPCKSKKSKTTNKKTNAEISPINMNGESAKIIGTSINLLNWNARGLGRLKKQKVQDLLGLMNKNDVQIAIVSETRESAGSQNQTQTQANGYTIYKNAYRDISHTSQYLSPEKMVWGVCLIVKNGLAFSISKIHDLTLGARLVHGTLTIPTKGHAQPMKVDILGVYGPATKDFAVNSPYREALLKYVGNLYKLHHREFTQGTRHIIIEGDWNSYLDQNLDIYREYNLLTYRPSPFRFLTYSCK